MKLGTENRRNLVIMLVLLVVAVFSVWHWISSSAPSSAASANAPANTPAAVTTPRNPATNRAFSKKRGPARPQPTVTPSLDPTLRFDLLRSSEKREYTGGRRNIFEAEQIEIPKPLPPTPKPQPNPGPSAQQPPPPPPINLKFYGFASKAGETKQIFLLSGDDVFLAREGEIVNRRYRVIRITNNAVEIEDVLNNNRQTIPLTAS